MKSDFVVFIDFDGTITSEDVGYEMFKKFTNGRTEPCVSQYRLGKINSFECLSTECDIWNKQPPNRRDVLDFLRRQTLSAGFDDFLKLIKRNNIDSYLVSEGFDFYIDIILNSNGYRDFERISNKAVYKGNQIQPEFPYKDLGCGKCSNCKGYHIRKLTGPRQSSLFIGDGHSDIHGARSADIVFAKSFLKEDLQKSGRHHFDYFDFHDIIKKWQELSKRRVFTVSEKIMFCRVSKEKHEKFESLWENGDVMKNAGYPNGLGWNRRQYDDFWGNLNRRNFMLFSIENGNGEFMGEAKLSFPDGKNICSHDVKLLPAFQGKGFGKEAWLSLLELSRRRWPNAEFSVTPAADNHAAIKMYEALGFESEGGQHKWVPSNKELNAEVVRYFEMIKKRTY